MSFGLQLTQFWKPRTHAGFKSRYQFDRTLGGGTSNDGLDGSMAAPQIGTTKHANARYIHEDFFLRVLVCEGLLDRQFREKGLQTRAY